MESKTVSETRTRMSQVMTPGHANLYGKVFGGALIAMVDLAAYTAASRFAENVCVTASFDRIDFHEPIEIGEVVTLDAAVTYAGRTSVEVTIEVWAENIFTGSKRHTNTARAIMVAVKDGRAVSVPSLVCETRDEKIAFLVGRARRASRGVATVDGFSEQLDQATDAEIDALLASG